MLRGAVRSVYESKKHDSTSLRGYTTAITSGAVKEEKKKT
jgi:hypothetical protein